MNAPADAGCNDQAVAFDILQHHVKALDQLLHNMADIDDIVDELTDAARRNGRHATAQPPGAGLQAHADRAYRRDATASN